MAAIEVFNQQNAYAVDPNTNVTVGLSFADAHFFASPAPAPSQAPPMPTCTVGGITLQSHGAIFLPVWLLLSLCRQDSSLD